MNAAEFSQEFDILFNNVASNLAPGLTEYEKSVFLTKSQDEIIKNHFTGTPGGNKYNEGLEDSRKRFADFSNLVSVKRATKIDGTSMDPRGVLFEMPSNILISLSETFSMQSDGVSKEFAVISLMVDEYLRLMSKPSSDPLKRQVWKIIGQSSTYGTVEIIPHWRHKEFAKEGVLKVRYIRKPHPIILEDLEPQGLTIDGNNKPGDKVTYSVVGKTHGDVTTYVIMNNVTNRPSGAVYNSELEALAAMAALPDTYYGNCCEVSEELHPEILQRAVELAKTFYGQDLNQTQAIIASGARSE